MYRSTEDLKLPLKFSKVQLICRIASTTRRKPTASQNTVLNPEAYFDGWRTTAYLGDSYFDDGETSSDGC